MNRWPWVAGFFDGDGCIAATLQKARYPYLRCQFANKDVATLKHVAELLAAEGIATTWSVHPSANGTYLWVNGFEASKRLLELLLPYLVGKRHQAELALEWVEYREALQRGSKSDELSMTYVEAIKKAKEVFPSTVPNVPKDSMVAWLAGFFDAEGCISGYARKSRRHTIDLQLELDSASWSNIVAADCVFSSLGVRTCWTPKLNRNPPIWRVMVVRKKDVTTVLRAIKPFSVTKALQISAALEWLEEHRLYQRSDGEAALELVKVLRRAKHVA